MGDILSFLCFWNLLVSFLLYNVQLKNLNFPVKYLDILAKFFIYMSNPDLASLFYFVVQKNEWCFSGSETCKRDRAAMYARISLFEYPQPSRSPMKINFSCPDGILKHQVQIITKIILCTNLWTMANWLWHWILMN